MKFALVAIALLGLCFVPYSFADNSTTAATPGAQKVPYKVAKEECLKQNASLKGKALRKCVHEKRQVASAK